MKSTPTPESRRRTARTLCAWCRATIAAKPSSPSASGAESHGLCAACARRLLRRRP